MKLTNQEIRNISLAVAGAVIALIALIFGTKSGFWEIYTKGFMVAGLMMLGCGILMTAFTFLKNHTSIFNLNTRIDAAQLGAVFGILLVLVILANIFVLPQMPKTKEETLVKMPPAMRIQVKQVESNFKSFFVLSTIVAAIAVASIPTIKFFKN